MIFSSPEFVLLFLPATVLLYYALLRGGYARFIGFFLFSASLVYYAWWRPENLLVILASIIFNYAFGQALGRLDRWRKAVFILGVAANLAALGFYKYTDFALRTLNSLLATDLPMQGIILPLGISFFTFQQVAYLSDIFMRKHDPAREHFLDYCCFVCFFPQLVAGPIVHHQEMMPQFHDAKNQEINWENIFNGIVLFSIGLAKKVLIADNLSPLVKYCFETSPSLTFAEAALGSTCYTLQLYFDFSAYSDMAVGAALLFNIRLPWNFDSPYKALDIQDFWRRWHITLSRWLRDYLYIPLGGNRKGKRRTLGNLVMTFLLGGLWHGAAWTFVIWGALHGIALAVHRLWRDAGLRLPRLLGWFLTFVFVSLAWVVFRAPDMQSLRRFAKGFLGLNGFSFSAPFQRGLSATVPGAEFTPLFVFVACALCMALLFPNSAAILRWRPQKKLYLAAALSVVALISIFMPESTPEFIYSKF
ncbi:MAG: MBOAT family protein [Desulfovibrio sp.]|uniref:MBOAT family O-acyltransferase n=1 Tax=Desulfovibrio sp. TaxID=885 RepID=UPI001A6C0136|nr:MBOAT family protein [Desulfovibrio sp.]MBD5416775.1 MBOAT family protein [Desulfovibrio sp.]